MSNKNDQSGFILMLLLLAIAIVSVIVYSFIRTQAREQGLELPF